MAEQMQAASDDMEFERAARLRDRIRALASIAQETQINPETVDEADVFALHAEGGQACVQVFFFRAGQNWGNRAYFPRVDKSDERRRDHGRLPRPVLRRQADPQADPGQPSSRPSADLLAEAFCLKAGRKVEIASPQRGEKRRLVDHALTNAREALGRKMAESSAQSKLLAGVCEAFGLEAPPERIEVYDNSHIMGTNAVGGMIVAGPDGFQKNQYRKFNISSTDITPGDDYGMMREVLRRRFARLVKEEEAGENPPRPDLVLIDGGAGQLAAAMEIMADLGVDDIARGRRRQGPRPRRRPGALLHPRQAALHARAQEPGALLPPAPARRGPPLRHRHPPRRRAIDMKKNPLDEIEGVGPARKKALLHAFGSARGGEPGERGRPDEGGGGQRAAGGADVWVFQEVTGRARGHCLNSLSEL